MAAATTAAAKLKLQYCSISNAARSCRPGKSAVLLRIVTGTEEAECCCPVSIAGQAGPELRGKPMVRLLPPLLSC